MLEQAFWQSIQETPDDDIPRLIYADWLEDHGEASQVARAEFIRIQCELARLPEDCRGARIDWSKREAVLWQQHGEAWSAPLRRFSPDFTFRRGFPDQVVVPCHTFLKYGDEILTTAPISSLRLRDCQDYLADLAGCPMLHRLKALSLEGNRLGPRGAQVLFASPYLGNLVELDLTGNELGAAGVEVLGPSHLPGLRSLKLKSNSLGDAGLEVLARAAVLGQLHTLGLASNGITDVGVAHLARSAHSAALTALDLGNNLAIGDPGALALAGSPHLARLEKLRLGADELVDPQVGDTRSLGSVLRMRRQGVTKAGARALASSASFTHLRELDLSGQHLIGVEGVQVMAEAAALSCLARLNLHSCGIRGGDGLEALTDAPFAHTLTSLDLTCNYLGDEGAETLALVPLPALRRLSLRFNSIGGRGAEALAFSRHFPSLEIFDLWGNRMTDAGNKALVARFGEAVRVQ